MTIRQCCRRLAAVVSAVAILLAGTAATNNPATAPAAAPIASDQKSPDDSYEACRQALLSIMAGFDRGDAAAVKSQLYFSPGSDPRLEKYTPAIIDTSMVVYHLQKAAIAKFGVHAIGLNYSRPTIVASIEDLLPRIDRTRASVSDDTVILNPAPSFGERDGMWPATPFYFHKVDGVWKVDMARCVRLKLHVGRSTPIAGETEDQTIAAACNLFLESFKTMTQDVESGKVQSAGELQQELDAAMVDLADDFPDFTVDVEAN